MRVKNGLKVLVAQFFEIKQYNAYKNVSCFEIKWVQNRDEGTCIMSALLIRIAKFLMV